MSTAAKMFRDQKQLLPKDGPVPNRRVLVVDDEPQIAEGIQRVLCPLSASTGGKASAVVRSSRSLKLVTDPAHTVKADEFDVTVVNTPEKALEAVTDSLRTGKPFAMGFFDVVLGADMD